LPRPAVLKALSKNDTISKVSPSPPAAIAKQTANQANAGKADRVKAVSTPAKKITAEPAIAKKGKVAGQKAAGVAKKPAGETKAPLKTASTSPLKKR
jgi:hypothetical protein